MGTKDAKVMKQLRERGKTWAEIVKAKFPGRTVNACSTFFSRTGGASAWARGKWTSEDDVRVRKLRNEGKSWLEIAKLEGRTALACSRRHNRRLKANRL